MDQNLLAQYNILFHIALESTKNGSTTWILKSLIESPNCIVVAYDTKAADHLKRKYYDLLNKASWWKKLKWRLFGRAVPRFESMGNFRQLKGYRQPIIFDNSCFIR